MLTSLLPEIIMKICEDLDFDSKSFGVYSKNVLGSVNLYYACKTFNYIKNFKFIGFFNHRNIDDKSCPWVEHMVDVRIVALNGIYHGMQPSILYTVHKKWIQSELYYFSYYDKGKETLYLHSAGQMNNITYNNFDFKNKLAEIWKNSDCIAHFMCLQIEIPSLLDSIINDKSLIVINKLYGLSQPIIEIPNLSLRI